MTKINGKAVLTEVLHIGVVCVHVSVCIYQMIKNILVLYCFH